MTVANWGRMPEIPPVLAIDRSEDTLNAIAGTIAALGCRPLLARGGVAGLAEFRQHFRDIRAVVLDFDMPDMNGDRALHHLRRIRDDVPVILCVSDPYKDMMLRFPETGVVAYLTRPPVAAELAEALRTAMLRRATMDIPPEGRGWRKELPYSA